MIKQVLKKMLKKMRAKQLVPIVTPVDKDKMLENKVVLITGGSSGIGLSIAEACLKSGAKVIIAGSTQSKIDDVLKEKKNPNLAGIVINIMDVSSLNNKVFEAASIFNGKIDVLINSAGAHHTHQFEDMPENEFDKIMNTNVKGTFFMCQKVVEHMKKMVLRVIFLIFPLLQLCVLHGDLIRCRSGQLLVLQKAWLKNANLMGLL